MNGYVLKNIYSKIEQENKPDKSMEIFWYGFKNSIENFYKNNINNSSIDIKKVSEKLNEYQKDENYRLIAKEIKKHIEIYTIELINLKSGYYHTNIAITNIKRWNKIINELTLENHKIYNVNYIIQIITTIYNRQITKCDNRLDCDLINKISSFKLDFVYDELSINLFNNYINEIIDLSIDLSCSYILDKLNEIYDVISYINNKYNLNLYKKIKGSKILSLIYNKLKTD